MIWAYLGSGSLTVLFKDAIPAPPTVTDTGAASFEQGYREYQSGNYRKAIAHFKQAIAIAPQFAEAHHNLGLALANLKQADGAARNLVAAGEMYQQQGKPEGVRTIRQNLEHLRFSASAAR